MEDYIGFYRNMFVYGIEVISYIFKLDGDGL